MRVLVMLVMLVMLVGATSARADSDDIVARPLVLRPGQVEAVVTLELELAPRKFSEPTSVAPDLWIGATPRWTFGLIHSNPSVDRIAAGASFCVKHSDIGCHRTYHGSGLDVRYAARDGALAVAPRARLLVRELGPFKPALTVGALARWQHGRLAVSGDPYLRLGLANRDKGNRAALVLPVFVTIQPTCRWAVWVQSGWDSDVAVWRDGWHVPLGYGVRVRVSEHLDFSASHGFPSVFGPQDTAVRRALFFALGWRT